MVTMCRGFWFRFSNTFYYQLPVNSYKHYPLPPPPSRKTNSISKPCQLSTPTDIIILPQIGPCPAREKRKTAKETPPPPKRTGKTESSQLARTANYRQTIRGKLVISSPKTQTRRETKNTLSTHCNNILRRRITPSEENNTNCIKPKHPMQTRESNAMRQRKKMIRQQVRE